MINRFAIGLALTMGGMTIASARPDVVIEAERAAARTVGREQTPGVWNLWSEGRVGQTLRFADAAGYEVVVRAHGSPAAGKWPEMALVVDGHIAKRVTVETPDPADFKFTIRVSAGLHEISVAFLNDMVYQDEDRNLYVDRFTIRPIAGAADPQIAAPEEMAAEMRRIETDLLASCDARIERHRKSDATIRVVDSAGRPLAGAEVEVELVRHDFLFGCNIYMFDRYPTDAKNAAYKKRFEELFNAATVGFYWRSYEPQRGRPRYDYTDKVVAWCAERGIRCKGHPLLWGNQAGVPRWSDGQPSPEIQRQRVVDIMDRYDDSIEFWEVVNEPSHLAEPKIDEPYRWARQADPDAYLIVNDYYVMANGHPPFFELLTKAKADGVPFDGIGIQAHEPRTMRFPLDRVGRVLDRYATLGKELHITEFTPASGGKPMADGHPGAVWNETTQADYAVKFYRTCFAHPAVMAVTWWDLCDHGSWLPGGGMLRADLSPKPVYEQLKHLIHTQWHTRTAGKTDAAGRYALRGFHGTYRVTVRREGQREEGEFHLAKEGENEWKVVVSGR